MSYIDKDYGSIPSLDSQSYVLAILGLSTIKRNLDAFSHINSFEEKIQEELIKLGVDLLKGTIDPDQYVKKFESLALSSLDKEKNKEVKFDEYVKEQIKMRVATSYALYSKDRMKLKENLTLPSAKQIAEDMRSFNPGNAYMKQGPEIYGNEVTKSYRNLGRWESNHYEEDDDNPHWVDYKKYQKLFLDWVSKQKWKKFVNAGVSSSEKAWAEFYVQLKK